MYWHFRLSSLNAGVRAMGPVAGLVVLLGWAVVARAGEPLPFRAEGTFTVIDRTPTRLCAER